MNRMVYSRSGSYERLRNFYDDEGIRAVEDEVEFRCPHTKECKAAANCDLSRGAEAHLGSGYGKAKALRVVVVSLDTGATSERMDQRRDRVEALHNKDLREMNPHMRGTTELLKAIYGAKTGESFYELFAMTNTAKCSRSGESSNMVPDKLYRNCSKYVVPELECLDPQLIVTQGAKAWNAIELNQPVPAISPVVDDWIDDQAKSEVARDWLRSLAIEYLYTLRVAGRDVPVIKTIHPSARQGQWQRFARTALQPVVAMAKYLAA